MSETGPSIDPGTHRGADDTLSSFAFFTRLSWQSWKSSLPLTERQATGQSHGRVGTQESSTRSLLVLIPAFFHFLLVFPPLEEHQGWGTRGLGRSHLHLYYLICLYSMLWIFYMCIGAFSERSMFNALLPTLFIYLVHTDIPLLQAACALVPVGMLMCSGNTLNVTYRGWTYLPAT